MGIDLRFGQLNVRVEEDYDGGYVDFVGSKHHTHPNAATFPNQQTYGLHDNAMGMSYSAWDNFLKTVGLRERFMTGRYPGAMAITEDMIREVALARYRWQLRKPQAVPGYWKMDGWAVGADGKEYIAETDTHYDYMLATLLRLEGWLNWAYRTQAQPVVHSY